MTLLNTKWKRRTTLKYYNIIYNSRDSTELSEFFSYSANLSQLSVIVYLSRSVWITSTVVILLQQTISQLHSLHEKITTWITMKFRYESTTFESIHHQQSVHGGTNNVYCNSLYTAERSTDYKWMNSFTFTTCRLNTPT